MKNKSANIKNDILNWVLFWPKNEWNPHSNALFFSWYGLWGENIKLTNKSIKLSTGINKKKKVRLDMLHIYLYKLFN